MNKIELPRPMPIVFREHQDCDQGYFMPTFRKYVRPRVQRNHANANTHAPNNNNNDSDYIFVYNQ